MKASLPVRSRVRAGLPLLCTFIASSVAVAGTASAGAPTFEAIPVGVLPAAYQPMTAKGAPDHIPATEKLEGFYPAVTPAAAVKKLDERGGYRYIYLFSNEAQAKGYAATGNYPRHEDATPGVCMNSGWSRSSEVSYGTYVPRKLKPGSPEWVADAKAKSLAAIAAAKRAQAMAAKKLPVKPASAVSKAYGVRSVRTERFVPGAEGEGTLEVVDAWFDTETLGVRLVGRSSVKFKSVATGPNALEIFAARDDKHIDFFITPPKVPAEVTDKSRLAFTANNLVAQLPGGSMSSFSSSACGYMHLSLATAPGSGQMASVLATAFLPPSPDEEGDTPHDDSDDERGNPDDEDRFDGRTTRAVRTRPVLANLSISQMAKETTPLLSISFAWAGPDQQTRF